MQALRLVDTKDMPKEEWLAHRRGGISGSDVSAICGLNPWKSAVMVYLDKKGQLPEQEDNDRMMWGRLLEPVIAEVFAERTGLKIQRRNAILQHPENTWALANIDRLIIDKDNANGVLEIKTTSEYNKEAWEEESVPDMYMLQLQWYLYVTGLQYGWFCTLAGGQKLYHTRVERNEEVIEYLVKICSDFWDNLQNDIMPEIDGSESATEALNILYPQANNEVLEFDAEEVGELIQQFDEAKAEIDSAKFRKDLAANQLKEMLGDATKAIYKGRSIIWSNTTSSHLDTKTLKEEHPEIYQKYLDSKPTRRFTIPVKKKGV